MNSRYWRSDLEEKNGWLCNNCGMNQRRGRGVNNRPIYTAANSSDDEYMQKFPEKVYSAKCTTTEEILRIDIQNKVISSLSPSHTVFYT